MSCEGGQICDEGACVDPPACVNDDDNSNDTASDATTLSGSGERLDDLSICTGDTDWFVLTLSDGQDAIIELNYTFQDGKDLDLELFAGDGTTLILKSDTASDNERIAIRPVTGETSFYIIVSGFLDDDENTYSLSINTNIDGNVCNTDDDCASNSNCEDDNICSDAPACSNDDDCGAGEACEVETGDCVLTECIADRNEPNNDADSAAGLTTSDQDIDGTVCAEDRDWYTFTLGAGQDAMVELQFTARRGDLDMRIYLGSEDNQIGYARSETDNETLGVPTVDTETEVFVEVYGFSNNSTPVENLYTLNIDIDPAGFACSRNEQCATDRCDTTVFLCETECDSSNDCGNGEICNQGSCIDATCETDPGEPNEIRDDSFRLEEGRLEGLAICDDDVDWFKIIVPDNTLLFVTVEHDFSDGDLDVRLLNGSGFLEDSGISTTDNEYVATRVALQGLYFLEVKGDARATNNYAINVEFDPQRDVCLEDSDCAPGLSCNREKICVGRDCTTNFQCPFEAPLCNLELEQCTGCEPDSFDLAGANDSADMASDINGTLNLCPDNNDCLNTCLGEDFYTFNATQGQNITVNLSSISTRDIDLKLIFPDRDFEVSTGGTAVEEISITAPETGAYTIQIYTVARDNPNFTNYKLDVTIN